MVLSLPAVAGPSSWERHLHVAFLALKTAISRLPVWLPGFGLLHCSFFLCRTVVYLQGRALRFCKETAEKRSAVPALVLEEIIYVGTHYLSSTSSAYLLP